MSPLIWQCPPHWAQGICFQTWKGVILLNYSIKICPISRTRPYNQSMLCEYCTISHNFCTGGNYIPWTKRQYLQNLLSRFQRGSFSPFFILAIWSNSLPTPGGYDVTYVNICLRKPSEKKWHGVLSRWRTFSTSRCARICLCTQCCRGHYRLQFKAKIVKIGQLEAEILMFKVCEIKRGPWGPQDLGC